MTDKILDRRRRGWLWIDNNILDHYGPIVGAYGIAVYAVLVRFEDHDDHSCYPAIPTIAKAVKVSSYTVREALHNLEQAGLITIERRVDASGDPTSNLYTLMDVGGGTSPHEPPPSPHEPGVPRHTNQGTASHAHEPILINNTQSEQEECSEPALQDDLWPRCLAQLKLQMTRTTYNTMLRNSAAQRLDGQLCITVPSASAVEWLDRRLRPAVEKTVAALAGEPLIVTFQCAQGV